jgi:hypothetical protein
MTDHIIIDRNSFETDEENWGSISSDSKTILHLQVDNKKLRQMLAFAYCGYRLYPDDGELQDNTEHPCIDFKRDSVDDIQHKIQQRVLAQYKLTKKKLTICLKLLVNHLRIRRQID